MRQKTDKQIWGVILDKEQLDALCAHLETEHHCAVDRDDAPVSVRDGAAIILYAVPLPDLSWFAVLRGTDRIQWVTRRGRKDRR